MTNKADLVLINKIDEALKLLYQARMLSNGYMQIAQGDNKATEGFNMNGEELIAMIDAIKEKCTHAEEKIQEAYKSILAAGSSSN